MTFKKHLHFQLAALVPTVVSCAAFTLSLLVVWSALIPATEGAQTVTISCVGDSNTDGWPGSRNYTPYPKPLQDLLGSNFKVNNFGKTNTTMLKKGSDPYWKRSQFKDAMNSKPDLVTIVLGTNDAKSGEWSRGGAANFQKDFEAMIDTFSQLPSKPQVVACTPFHMLKGSFGMSISTMENEIVPAAKKAAAAKKIKLIDLYSATDDAKYFDGDGVHVNNNGHKFFAQVFKDSILAYIKLWGCTDSTKSNYNPKAIRDDGSCLSVQVRAPHHEAVSFKIAGSPVEMRIFSLDGTLLLKRMVTSGDVKSIRETALAALSPLRSVGIVQVGARGEAPSFSFRVYSVK